MDKNPITTILAEFIELGFTNEGTHIVRGRVPSISSVNGIYIDVEINLEDFPFQQPSVRLVSINGDNELYKIIPKDWKHLDELVYSNNLKKNLYVICCLHNWKAHRDYNGIFIYNRILNWLESNTNGAWEKDGEVQGWRMTPQLTLPSVYLSETITKQIRSKSIHRLRMLHDLYEFINRGIISGSKVGTDYVLKDINFNKNYKYFPYIKDQYFNKLSSLNLKMGKTTFSEFIVIRLPKGYSFNTYYQLLMTIRNNFTLNTLTKGMKNIPFIILYKGYLSKIESVAFITDEDYINKKEEFMFFPLKIETIPNRPIGIDLRVGLLGVGSLGSQVARILTDKQTKEIILFDKEKLSADNLGHHELDGFNLGDSKALALGTSLSIRAIGTKVIVANSQQELIEKSDILVVTVGSGQEYDRLAFNELFNYEKPIIWAWTSPYNILQEVVITTQSTGCLNCYYHKLKEDPILIKFEEMKQKELEKMPAFSYDFCGNPHTISRWEGNVFFASQIVAILEQYSKDFKFKFNHFSFYRGMNDILATPYMGILTKNQSCEVCNGGI